MVPDQNYRPASPQVHRQQSSSQLQEFRNVSIPRPASARMNSASSSRRQSVQLSSSVEQFPSSPQRHSRPMTPAELHLEMEREQEGIVNRLSRELQSLRAHSSSMASNTSATSSQSHAAHQTSNSAASPFMPPVSTQTDRRPSAGVLGSANQQVTQSSLDSSGHITSPRVPTSSRQHRSSSSSMSNASRSQSFTSSVLTPPHPPSGMASQASVDRARDAAGIPDPTSNPYIHSHPTSRSRQGSIRSAQPSPILGAAFGPPYPGERRPSRQPSFTRSEEAVAAQDSLNKAKSENADLIAKVKQLEKELREVGKGEEMRGRVSQPRFMQPPDKPQMQAMETSS